MTLTTQDQQNIVTKIKESKSFSKSSTSSALLQYLLEATQKGTNLKEGVIDIDFFSNYKNSESNARVRVSIYNLRKRLAKYYDNEGKEDQYHISIEKGQYKVHFEKKKHHIAYLEKHTWSSRLSHILLVGAVLYIIMMHIPPKKPQVWSPFLNSDKITSLYVGDLFCSRGKTITGFGWTRDYWINNIDEFYQYIRENPEMDSIITPANFTVTTSLATLSVQRLQEYYLKYNSEFLIRFLTRTSTSEIKEGNAVYIGSLWNNNKFNSFFNEANPYCTLKRKELIISNHPEIEDKTYSLYYHTGDEEFAIVSKYPAIDGTEHLVFMSQHEIGVIASVDFFTNTDSLKSFTDKYLQKDKYFTAIFTAKGQDRSNTALILEEVITF